ncbi:hypothetical protein PENSPDRAFT_685787 [Peniophora sp. CONT]|nr:hypothetical protein PENSPDRAFT_685787 [Peniophora sp. CONT]
MPPSRVIQLYRKIPWVQAASIGLDGLHTLLEVLDKMDAVFPPLSAIVGGLTALRDVYERTKRNREVTEVTAARLDRNCGILARRIEQDPTMASNFAHADYAAILQVLIEKVRALHQHSRIVRTLSSADHESALKSVCDEMADVMQTLQFELGLSIERNTEAILREIVFQKLVYAHSASYNADMSNGVSRRSCTEGTRFTILRDILVWARDESSLPIFWIYGPAGQGKTTIAYTICERLAHNTKHVSMISCFCSRQQDSHEGKVLIPTLVLRLAEQSASFATKVVAALTRQSNLGDLKLEDQLYPLLVEPWKTSVAGRKDLPPIIMIIDALDENEAGILFVKGFLAAVQAGDLPGLRVLFTSRPDPELVKLLGSDYKDLVFPKSLHFDANVNSDDRRDLDADIVLYLNEELPNHRNAPDLIALADVCAGLFVYASTAVLLVKPKDRVSAGIQKEEEVIRQLVTKASVAIAGIGQGHAVQMDTLYENILQEAFGSTSLQEQDPSSDPRTRFLLTFIIVSRIKRVDMGTVCYLAGVHTDVAESAIAFLQSVLYTDPTSKAIFCYHTSFEDYLLRTQGIAARRTRKWIVQHSWNMITTDQDRTRFDFDSRKPWSLDEGDVNLLDVSYAVKLAELYPQLIQPGLSRLHEARAKYSATVSTMQTIARTRSPILRYRIPYLALILFGF